MRTRVDHLLQELLKGTQLLSEIGKKYKLNEDFESSREETMKHIIEYIINQYTSVTHYLEQCGLSADDQSLIRRNLELGGSLAPYDSHGDGVQSQAVSIEVQQFGQGLTSEKDTANQKVNLQVMRPASSFVIAGNVTCILFQSKSLLLCVANHTWIRYARFSFWT